MAVPLADQYMLAASLQQGFIDKDSGQLLAFGYINFFRDVDRTTRKPIYEIGGPPDAPTYTELPNPLFLSAIGTFQDPDNQQDIIPYYKPYDANGNIDLYYITVYSADNVLQFTREHFPSVINSSGNATITSANTLLPNGQFWSHMDLFDDGLLGPDNGGEIAIIAPGGWKFRQTFPTSSITYVTFQRYDAPSDTPEQNPRYAVEVKCTQADPADAEKQLYCVVGNVNFMQGEDLTVSFTAYSNDGNNHNVNFIINKFYGTGGSPETIEIIATVLVTPQIQVFTIPFTMSSNIGKTLGTDDDQIQFTFQSPLATTSDILFTNIFLIAGTFSSLDYPPIDLPQDRAYTLASSFAIPAYDSSQLGQYVQLVRATLQPAGNDTGYGYTYNSPVPVGTVLSYGSESVPDEFVKCNGAAYSVTVADDFPSTNRLVPLFQVIGYNYGVSLNGFVYAVVSASVLSVTWVRFDVLQAVPNAGTSGFTFTLVSPAVVNTSPQIYTLTVVAASAITPGSYYIQTVNTTGPQFIQMFWFTVDGIGTRPVVPFDVSVSIALSSTDTATQVRDKIIAQANGLYQVPDLRGIFIRYWNDNAPTNGGPFTHDSLADSRDRSTVNLPYVLSTLPSYVPSGQSGNHVGSYQTWGVGSTNAGWEIATLAGTGPAGTSGFTDTNVTIAGSTTFIGYGTDNRPNNLYFNAIIKT